MELLELNAEIRTATGKGAGRALRRESKIPGVVYGPKTETRNLSVAVSDMEKLLKEISSYQAPLKLLVKNGETTTQTVMIKELQVHPVSRNFLHVDFYEVAMDQKILFQIPVEIVGTPQGIEEGGLLQVIRRELDVLCFPLDIPESIKVDVSELTIGDAIHVEEIPLEGDYEIVADSNFTILTVTVPSYEEIPEEEEEEEEVEGEEGEEEEGEGEAEEGEEE